MRSIYLIRGKTTNLVKIGIAANPSMRMSAMQIGSPDILELMAAIKPTHPGLEAYLHRHFRHLRVHGEWFDCADTLAAWLEADPANTVP